MNVIIVEDEIMIFRRLKRMMESILNDKCTSIQSATNLKQATSLAKKFNNVLVCLDLNLSGEDGFDLLRRAVVEPFQVVVVSANVDRAVEAFDLGVVDFVVKPFTQERLAKALDRVLATQKGQTLRQIAAVKNGKMELINLEDIVAIHGDGDYSNIETVNGTLFLHNKTLKNLEGQLPDDFIRVHRSHLVNRGFIRKMVRSESGNKILLCENDVEVPVGRSFNDALERALKIIK